MEKQYFLDKISKVRPKNLEIYSYDLLPGSFPHDSKIEIICKKHGVFKQAVTAHLNYGGGCPTCGNLNGAIARRKTTESFVRRSIARFGDRLNYDKTVYHGKSDELSITCNKHGDFTVAANIHLRSRLGCPQCLVDERKDLFLNNARNVHGGRYDYSRINFVNAMIKVEIVCHLHGSFWQLPRSHSSKGSNCPICVIEEDRLGQRSFVAKAQLIHGDRYDYSKVGYVTGSSKVVIGCPTHGDFQVRASSHLEGISCIKCKRLEFMKSTEQFILDAKIVHGDRYDYGKANYLGNKKLIEIICKRHGSFWQKPNSHLSSKMGCRFCRESKGEVAVEVFLRKRGIKYIREYRLQPHRHRSDFYLPLLDMHIEFNGLQHYKSVEMFGGEDAFRKTRENDEFKRRLIMESGAELLILTHAHLTEGTLEQELLRGLERHYRRWRDENKIYRL